MTPNAEYCTGCGQARPADANFCANCGTPRGDDAGRSADWLPRATSRSRVPLLLILASLAVGGASVWALTPRGAPVAVVETESPPIRTPPAIPTPVPVAPNATPLPPPPSFVAATPVPVEAPTLYGADERIVINRAGREWAAVTVSQVGEVTEFEGDFYTDTPDDPGHVYLQAWVEYEAMADGVSYNPFDWQLFVDDVAVESNFTLLLNQPEPQLSSGTLPQGRRAAGWVVYEVPDSGRVLMSYGGAFSAPMFEVVLREG